MKVSIDKAAGFCPGVKRAINKAENNLQEKDNFFSLGSLLHNELEMERLGELGLQIIGKDDIPGLCGKQVLFRAHGEAPDTYELTKKHKVEVIDATCGVVKKLQRQVAAAANEMEKLKGQVVIFGKAKHPEVIGLLGHTKGLGVIIGSFQDLSRIDMDRPIRLFSQTTMDDVSFELISDAIKLQMLKNNPSPDFISKNTICGHVLGRVPSLKKFASEHEVIIFVSGRESSNGKKLFKTCSEVNLKSHFVTEKGELDAKWFEEVKTVGVSGSASTPQWLMEEIAAKIEEII